MSISSIQSNFGASAAVYNLNRSTQEAALSSARLSSGNRHALAADGPGQLAIGKKMAAQLSGMRSALTNASQGASMMQVAAGGISQIMDILADQQSLAIQAQDGSLSPADRSFLNQTFQELSAEIDSIANSTTFNGKKLLAGGLGATSSLVTTDALAAAFDPSSADINTGSSAAGTTPIEAFDRTDGSSRAGTGTAGFLEITDAGGTALADEAYGGANTALYGQFSGFTLTNVTYGTSATLTATINGVEFSGTVADGDSTALLNNGSTFINLGTTAIDLTDQGTTSSSEAQLGSDFANTIITRTGIIGGVSFAGTRLEDAIGTATTGVGSLRLADTGEVSISNFRYLGNAGADANVLAVDINGRTFSATSVTDSIDDGAGTVLAFDNGNGEALLINITGLTGGTNTAINDIRNSLTDRKAFIDALNVGFSRAGGGANFNVSGTTSDSISVHLDSAATSNLYGGQSLDINTIGSATTTQTAIESALQIAGEIQAKIGAYQSRFDYAAASLESAILGQDEGRANLLDTDVAAESVNFATQQVMVQAGVAALAQANLMPSYLIDLMRQ